MFQGRHRLSGFLSWSQQHRALQRDGRPLRALPACPPAGSLSQTAFWTSPAVQDQKYNLLNYDLYISIDFFFQTEIPSRQTFRKQVKQMCSYFMAFIAKNNLSLIEDKMELQILKQL